MIVPYFYAAGCTFYRGDCLRVLPEIPDGSIDAVVSDPPYPEIDRDYVRLTEAEWHTLMDGVVAQCRRVLKPTGSAVFILQPNSERVGRMRTWLWEFMAKWGREWGIVQDAWWWNFTRSPTVHCQRTRGLMRPSVKACVWLGAEDCYRDQGAVLWSESEANATKRVSDRIARRPLEYQASGGSMRQGRCAGVAAERGGVTPFNLIPIANSDSASSAGANGHGAGTPVALCRWWIRYICPPGGTVLDPFAGAGSVNRAAYLERRKSVGIERMPEYCDVAKRLLKNCRRPAGKG